MALSNRLAFVAAALAAACSTAAGQQPRPDVPAPAGDTSALLARIARWRVATVPGTGPYPATRVEDPTLPTHTIYRPADLSRVPGKLPIVAFGNGGCRNTSVELTAFLADIASRGYVVVAQGRNDVLFAEDYSLTSNGHPVQVVDPARLTRGIDWATAEGSRPGSPYYSRLDDTKVAYVGHSCGGRQALSASVDRRTKATIVLNSGYPPPGEPASTNPTSRPVPEVPWSALRAPMLILGGGPRDSAYNRTNYNFRETTLPAFKAHLDLGHTGPYDSEIPDQRWVKVVVGWLDWHLKGDEKAKALFVGPKCGVCVDPDWTEVASKHLK